MLDQIIEAINNHRVVTFTYSEIARVAEPHAVGISRAGNQVLRCYQTHGGHVTPGHEWDLCELALISNLVVTDKVFQGERTGYRRGDKHMTTIYAEL